MEFLQTENGAARVWVTAADDKYGTNSCAFATEREAEDHLLNQVGEDRESFEAWQAENPGKNLFDFLSENSDYLATYNFESFDLPLSPILAEAPAMLEALRKAHWLLCELEAPAHLDEGAEIDTLITGILARIDGNSLSAQEND